MRVDPERRGAPDRSRVGNFRSSGRRASPQQKSTNPRRGNPDRSLTGTARGLDRRAEARNRIRAVHGFDFDRLIIPSGLTIERPVEPFTDIRYNTSLSRFEGYNGATWDDLSAAGSVPAPTDITFAYDVEAKVTDISFASGRDLAFTYNSDGSVNTIADDGGGDPPANTKTFAYNADGTVDSITVT